MRTLPFLAGAVATALTVGLATAPELAAQYPTKPPAAMPIQPAQFPPFVEATLPNGLRLLVVTNRKQPVLSLTLSIPAGGVHDPATRVGLSEMMAGLLTKGAGSRSADQISAAIEGVGGTINAFPGSDFITVNASVLAADKQLAFDLLADVVMRPTFPETEVELLRKQTLSSLALAKSQPASIASRFFAKGLYGEHPYGRSADEASVGAITRDELVAFHGQRVRPGQALLVIAGAIDAAEARQMTEAAFGAWSGAPMTAAAPRPAPQRTTSEILLVHRPGSVQANLVVGNTTWPPTDTRGFALTLANQVLGGAADARLFSILREEKGWTYGAYSNVSRRKQLGNFTATAEVRNAVADSALTELLAQMRKMGTTPVPAAEFEQQKQALVGQFPLTIETADAVASQVANARLLGLPTDYVQTYRQRLAAVTPAQAMVAAKAAIRADAAYIVVVGDAVVLGPKLTAIAPVSIVDVEGKALTAADLEVKTGAIAVDPARLVASADSFAILVQGNEFGFQTSQLAREGDGWVYTERAQIASFVQQNAEVRFGADLALRGLQQSGQIQGQPVKLTVTVANGKASGEGNTPGAQGMTPVKYADVAIPAGTLEESLASVIMPLFTWGPKAKHTFAVFASSEGTVQSRTLEVVGEGTVTLRSGGDPIAAYQVQSTGGQAPGTFWIEKAAPHRLLRFGPGGQPIEFVRVK
jgi:zinc protease